MLTDCECRVECLTGSMIARRDRGCVQRRAGWGYVARTWRGLSAIAFVALAAIAFMLQPAGAATFELYCFPRSRVGCDILMQGVIEPGDSAKFLQVLRSRGEVERGYGRLYLDSPGGDVAEALKLAEIVRNALLVTSYQGLLPPDPRLVGDAQSARDRRFTCLSACVLIYISGSVREPPRAAHRGLGLHRPFLTEAQYRSLSPNEVALRQEAATLAMRDYLMAAGMPNELIEQMMRRSSKEAYWLDEHEALSIAGKSVWWEELIIARCGHDPVESRRSGKELEEAVLELWDKPDSKKLDRWLESADSPANRERSKCIDQTRLSAQRDVIRGSTSPQGARPAKK